MFGGDVFGVVGVFFYYKQFKIQVDRVVKMRKIGEKEKEVRWALFLVSFLSIVFMFQFV